MNKKILQFFQALSDETRLSIVLSIMDSPKAVTDIHKAIDSDITLSAVSHQLRYLSNLGIITCKRNGREKVYRPSDDFCWCILKDADNHFNGKCGCCKK
jgi:DNA-binding transcriptional ArsR family regulator